MNIEQYQRFYWFFTRKIVFPLTKRDPEVAHNLAIFALNMLKKGKSLEAVERLREKLTVNDSRLSQKILDLTYENPVSMAAGFNKYADGASEGLRILGFGHHCLGSITWPQQDGDKRPRLERHVEEETLINHMGLNNDGAIETNHRLHKQPISQIPLRISIAKSNRTSLKKAPEEMANTFEKLRDHMDMGELNISCVNSPDCLALQQTGHLARIIDAIQDKNYSRSRVIPIVLKVSPDRTWSNSLQDELGGIVEVAKARQVVGIAGPNTTKERFGLTWPWSEIGGMSGPQCFEPALEANRFLRQIWPESILIMSSGINSAERAFEALKIVNLIDLITAFVFRGPLIAYMINSGLIKLMEKEGITSLPELRAKYSPNN